MELSDVEKSLDEFRRKFDRHVTSIDRSGVSSSKNKQLEGLIAAQTGWPTVAVKFVSSPKQFKNRISEIYNRPERPKHVVLLVSEDNIDHAVRCAKTIFSERDDFLVMGIATADRQPAVITDLIHRKGIEVPTVLAAAFPEMSSHVVSRGDSMGLQVEPTAMDALSDYSPTDCARDAGIDVAVIESWLRRLRRKKHLIFQGPPGTGKTYVAKQLSKVLVADPDQHIETVQFHPSYSYEDFVQGIRPILRNGRVAYALKPGRFLQFCKRATEAPESAFVLIIDELNRGNVSRIFGELLYLLEYRSESIPLAQGKEPFSIPQNVYIIATMNTADRSIALVDHALRRRFSFVFLGPDYGRLERHLERVGCDSIQLVDVLRRINTAIGDRNYHIGTSFFESAGADLPACLQDVWEGEIEPYLDEYFFDQPSKVDEFRWERLILSDLSRWRQPSDSEARG